MGSSRYWINRDLDLSAGEELDVETLLREGELAVNREIKLA